MAQVGQEVEFFTTPNTRATTKGRIVDMVGDYAFIQSADGSMHRCKKEGIIQKHPEVTGEWCDDFGVKI